MPNNVATLAVKVDPKGAVFGANKSKKAIKGIGRTARRVKEQVFSLQGALVGLGAGAVLRSALKYTATVENLGVRLKFITGNAEDASQAFDTMLEFAAEAPFTLQEIQNASPSLLTVADNVDELGDLLKMTGDIAAVSGLSFEEVGQQLQRSFSGGIAAADLFRDTGVKAMLGFQTGVQYTAEQTKKHMVDMWKEGTFTMVGATKELAKTFDGQVSMMKDAWDALSLAFMKEGIFDETKGSVQDITDWLKSPEVIQGAKDLGGFIADIAVAVKNTIANYMALPEWVRNTGLILALFGGAKLRIAITGLALLAGNINKFTDSFEQMPDAQGDVKAYQLIVQELAKLRELEKQLTNERDKASKRSIFGGALSREAQHLQTLRSAILSLERDLAKITASMKSRTASPHEGLPDLTSLESAKKATEEIKKSYNDLNTTLSATINIYENMSNHMVRNQAEWEGAIKVHRDLNTTLSSTIDIYENIGDHMDRNQAEWKETADAIKEAKLDGIVADIARSMEDSITNAVMNIGQGVSNMKDFFKSMVNIILEQFVRIKIAQPAVDWLTGGTGGGTGGGGIISDIIKGIFSGDGGGYTGSGGRVGGIDGKGGFPAILHPQETIIDHTKKQDVSRSVNVSFNITANDTEGFDDLLESRRGMIVGLINQAMNDKGTMGVA